MNTPANEKGPKYSIEKGRITAEVKTLFMLPTVNESVGVNKLVVFYRWRANTCLWRQWSVGLLVSVSIFPI